MSSSFPEKSMWRNTEGIKNPLEADYCKIYSEHCAVQKNPLNFDPPYHIHTPLHSTPFPCWKRFSTSMMFRCHRCDLLHTYLYTFSTQCRRRHHLAYLECFSFDASSFSIIAIFSSFDKYVCVVSRATIEQKKETKKTTRIIIIKMERK